MYYTIQNDYAGIEEIDDILYNPHQQHELFKTCQDDEKIEVHAKYNPAMPAQGIVFQNETHFTVLAKHTRCNDTFVAPKGYYPELAMPNAYSIHSTHGVGLYLRSAMKAAWVLAETAGYNNHNTTEHLPQGPPNVENFWYLFESSQNEGIQGVFELRTLIRDEVLTSYKSSRTAFLVTYIITLIYAIALFLGPFFKIQKDLANESRNNRNILLMIPMNVVSKTKVLIEYIERIFDELNY